eukprot:TRINITY_DN7405_c0_g1_i1.p2 TRINITY_DN7405_c0_g1~~TRINITY_DN7405_c0_g1_i1.p2  ORF type:complete len:109 (-),score=5.40 TRINITY_DN7405_c0_g1_i1:41-367(-)
MKQRSGFEVSFEVGEEFSILSPSPSPPIVASMGEINRSLFNLCVLVLASCFGSVCFDVAGVGRSFTDIVYVVSCFTVVSPVLCDLQALIKSLMTFIFSPNAACGMKDF